MTNLSVENIIVQKIKAGNIADTSDSVAVEDPLEIILEYSNATGKIKKNIAVTMRTPGNDNELAAGFLFTEGIIQNMEHVRIIKQQGLNNSNILVVLHENILPKLNNTARNFYSTSSCGICGKASIENIKAISPFVGINVNFTLKDSLLYHLPGKLKEQQKIFESTGGIHAAALFDTEGEFMMMREDVGRHNALDKIIGTALLNKMLPLSHTILLLSGRASFELVQKAVMAGIKIVVAVGAPSSLAVELAKENDITLIGFLREDRFNIYSCNKRVVV